MRSTPGGEYPPSFEQEARRSGSTEVEQQRPDPTGMERPSPLRRDTVSPVPEQMMSEVGRLTRDGGKNEGIGREESPYEKLGRKEPRIKNLAHKEPRNKPSEPDDPRERPPGKSPDQPRATLNDQESLRNAREAIVKMMEATAAQVTALTTQASRLPTQGTRGTRNESASMRLSTLTRKTWNAKSTTANGTQAQTRPGVEHGAKGGLRDDDGSPQKLERRSGQRRDGVSRKFVSCHSLRVSFALYLVRSISLVINGPLSPSNFMYAYFSSKLNYISKSVYGCRTFHLVDPVKTK